MIYFLNRLLILLCTWMSLYHLSHVIEPLTLMLFLDRQFSKSKLRKFDVLGGLDVLNSELSNISLVRIFFDYADVCVWSVMI